MSTRARRILIIDGHPDPAGLHFVHALVQAYAQGAKAGGHEVRVIEVASLEFPGLRSPEDFLKGEPPSAIREAQEQVMWAEHLVILFPLWLGSMPSLLKAFFEQLLRPGFAFAAARGKGLPRKLLKGRSARIVVTMGMPALFYRWVYRAHSLKSLERNILAFCGIGPIRASVIGTIESAGRRGQWLAKLGELGKKAG